MQFQFFQSVVVCACVAAPCADDDTHVAHIAVHDITRRVVFYEVSRVFTFSEVMVAHTTHRVGDVDADRDPSMRSPPRRTSCHVSAVHEAHTTRDVSISMDNMSACPHNCQPMYMSASDASPRFASVSTHALTMH
jgi:hypothetical protein